MLTFDVVPGKRVGDFVLGMPICKAIKLLQERQREISVVEVQYNANEVLSADICLDLKEEGMRFHFDALLQTLKFVDVYDLSKVCLKYEGKAFTGSRAPDPTLLALYAAFGPSYPGTLHASNYHLDYPGVGFSLPVQERYAALFKEGKEAPVELPDGTVPLATRLRVFRGKHHAAPEHVSLTKVTNKLEGCENYFEPVLLRVGQGLELPARNAKLPLGCYPQDVLAVLGSPDGRHSKTDNKLKIHSNDRSNSPPSESRDYFYNYFSLGIDVLFDGVKNTAKKFVAHSNYPMHDSFNQYSKCNWVVVTETSLAVEHHHTWCQEVKEALCIGESHPVVHNRPDMYAPAHISTYFYGRPALILEVMKNNLIESVLLYE